MATTTNKKVAASKVSLAVTALQSLASSATVGWKSVWVDDTGASSTGSLDYEIFVKLTTANTAPANDKAAYVYVVPLYYDGSAMNPSDGGTTTLPTSADASYTIANPNNMKLLGVLNYTTQQMTMQGIWMLTSIPDFKNYLPDGFGIVIINFTGAALSTGCIVDYRAISETNS